MHTEVASVRRGSGSSCHVRHIFLVSASGLRYEASRNEGDLQQESVSLRWIQRESNLSQPCTSAPSMMDAITILNTARALAYSSVGRGEKSSILWSCKI